MWFVVPKLACSLFVPYINRSCSVLLIVTVKKQKHDMTHVEVWYGEGPKTIGSRWHRGHVQIFDSYRFEAKSYHSETYHFKSIDTWLMGICRRY